MSDQKEMSPEEQNAWLREQYQSATKYLAAKGLITESVAEKESRYLVPLIAVWKLNLMDKSKVWVIAGDVPTDHVSVDAAATARDALRQFSFKWQIQAESLMASGGEEQKTFANHLIGRAEGLYNLFNNEELWQQA